MTIMLRPCRHCARPKQPAPLQIVVSLADDPPSETGVVRTVIELACGHRYATLGRKDPNTG